MLIRPSFTVLGGTAIGLVAGVAVYGAVSTASAATAPSVKPVKANVAAAPVAAARCAAGQKFEHGVCIIHVQRTVVVAAPSAAGSQARSSSAPAGAVQRSAPAPSSDDATKAGDTNADDAAEHATEDGGSHDSGDDVGGPQGAEHSG